MAIKRISELDLFTNEDLRHFLSTKVNITSTKDLPDTAIASMTMYDPAKLSIGLWFEVSTPLEGLTCINDNTWDVIPVNEKPSYFLSKKINANDISKLFEWKFKQFIDQVLCGPINYYGSQNFGEANSQLNDGTDTVWYDNREYIGTPDNPNRLCVMIPSDFTNHATFHNLVDFHNIVNFHGKDGNNDGNITFNTTNNSITWNGKSINVKGPWARFGKDVVIDGTAYITNLEGRNAHITNLKVDAPIDGTCMRAMWADLAENYESDNPYPPGTLVKFGGEKEITIATDTANAVVTTRPGFSLNESMTKDCLGIALVGRVPVRVVGKVQKFNKIGISDIPGVGTVIKESKPIGIALESSDIEEEKLIECVVQLTL